MKLELQNFHPTLSLWYLTIYGVFTLQNPPQVVLPTQLAVCHGYCVDLHSYMSIALRKKQWQPGTWRISLHVPAKLGWATYGQTRRYKPTAALCQLLIVQPTEQCSFPCSGGNSLLRFTLAFVTNRKTIMGFELSGSCQLSTTKIRERDTAAHSISIEVDMYHTNCSRGLEYQLV